jgi:uncharacterized protein
VAQTTTHGIPAGDGWQAAGPVAPTTAARLTLSPDHVRVRFTGGFWGHYQDLNRRVTIPHGMRMLVETGSLENFRRAAGVLAAGHVPDGAPAEYSMPLFRDSDVYKVLEAIGWERRHGRDEEQDRFHSEAVALARSAQRPDGYLNSYVEVVEGGRRFTNPDMGHELYCAGHMLQAAVADMRSGGDGQLAVVAGRYADLLAKEVNGELASYVPGHPEIETALVEFARAAGRPELVTVAGDLIARRGRSTLRWRSFGPAYFSDDVPFEQADSIRGHAVRALYLLAGAADTYTENGSPGLLPASVEQWEDMVSSKTYLTGGIGARHKDEAFGEAFELPPDRAYCETCAAIASIQASWRLLLITGESRFADLMERTLANGFLSGLGLDGKSFFYVNPLHARAPVDRDEWQECACCPPNIMRLLASMDHYVATATPDGVQVHQFATGELRAELPGTGPLVAEAQAGWPDSGHVSFRITQASGRSFDLAVRVPSWQTSLTVAVNGQDWPAEPGKDGYLHLRRSWAANDRVDIEFGTGVREVRPDPRVDAVRSCVAFERGPLVYCLESPDLPDGAGLDDVAVTGAAAHATTAPMEIAGHRVTSLVVPGLAYQRERGTTWPYRTRQASHDPARVALRAIPYYSWANRGPAEMRVWIPELP